MTVAEGKLWQGRAETKSTCRVRDALVAERISKSGLKRMETMSSFVLPELVMGLREEGESSGGCW